MVEIKGIISPILTPMKNDESVNYERASCANQSTN